MSRCFKTNTILFHLKVCLQVCLLIHRASRRSQPYLVLGKRHWNSGHRFGKWGLPALSHSDSVMWINDLTSLSCSFSPAKLR